MDSQNLELIRSEAEHWLRDSEPPVPWYPRQSGLPRRRAVKIIATRGCWAGCDFCGFHRVALLNKNRPPAPVLEIAQATAELAHSPAADLVKLVTGLSFGEPSLYFTRLIAAVKRQSGLPVYAFSAVEIDHLCRRENRPARQILTEWRDAGMDHIGPGGSELLVDSVRQQVAPYRLSVERFLEIHRVAHQSGIKTVAGLMIDGHTNYEHILEHLDHLQTLSAGLEYLELQCFDPEGSGLAMVPGPRLDQILRTLKAIKAMLPKVAVHLNLRAIASDDAEILLAEAGLNGVIETLGEIEPSSAWS
ncbi:MAG: radical SAM protein [Firmicutes bacterium]|jgi:2-iminoacetate synthase ThiH|nr:radical SAM protein [Bacillota bacterium]MCL5064809.1 radical SAM protein [Bacillota bacterium]